MIPAATSPLSPADERAFLRQYRSCERQWDSGDQKGALMRFGEAYINLMAKAMCQWVVAEIVKQVMTKLPKNPL